MFRFLFFGFFLFFIFAEARETICLNMIVKNESQVIRRCLESVKPWIDYWVIVDTGSNDGTQNIIRSYLRDIPGELYERPWRNFGENRSEAFTLAKNKGDYILLLDADDILVFEPGFSFPDLTQDLYHMWRGSINFSYLNPQLVRGDLSWKWIGVTHEYLSCDTFYTSATLGKVKYVSGDGGHRSIGNRKFFEDIEMLKEGLEKEPDNERYAFYLATSYQGIGEKGKALEWFQNRVSRGGWPEEVFWSMLQIAHLLKDFGLPANIVKTSYLNAFTYRPHRVEPLYFLAEICNQERDYENAYAYLEMRRSMPDKTQKDALFNMDWIDDYGFTFQRSITAFYLGKYRESLELCDLLLENPNLPESWRELTLQNRKFPEEKIKELVYE